MTGEHNARDQERYDREMDAKGIVLSHEQLAERLAAPVSPREQVIACPSPDNEQGRASVPQLTAEEQKND
jgi:hypothetical protein